MSPVRFWPKAPFYAGIAHLVERHLAKVEVASSSLVARSTHKKPHKRLLVRFFAALPHFQLTQKIMSGSTAIQRNYNVEVTLDWKEPLRLYLAIIAEPDEKKSAIISRMSNPAYDFGQKASVSAPQKILAAP